MLGVKPLIPHKLPEWNTPAPIPNDRVFSILTICRHCLAVIAPGSDWTDNLKKLLAEFPAIPREQMGFPPGWENHRKWR